MIIETKTKDFSRMTLSDKKKILSKFFGHKVNQIASGALTNGTHGQLKVRHDVNAYSNLRITTTEEGFMHIEIWNFQTEKWQEEAE